MKGPLVTVVMPVFNGERHVAAAIGSILRQTLSDFELVIVDDGSTDDTAALVEAWGGRDARIRVVRQGHRGLSEALNAGFAVARAPYVARMDHDDESHPTRLARQLELLRARPDVAVCGTWIENVDGAVHTTWRYPTRDAMIRSSLIFGPALAHPAVMIRREVFVHVVGGYRSEYAAAEDYDLWVRMAPHGHFANVPCTLLRRWMHDAQTTRRLARDALMSARRIRIEQLALLGVTPDIGEARVHEALSTWRFTPQREFLGQALAWFGRLGAGNRRTRAFPEPAFSRVLGQRWFAACSAATSSGPWPWRIFWQSPLRTYAALHPKATLGFALRCAGARYV